MSFERNLIKSYNVVHQALVTGKPRAQIMIREPVLQGLKNDLKNAHAKIEKLSKTNSVLEMEAAILRGEISTYKERLEKLKYLSVHSYPQVFSNPNGSHIGPNIPTIEQIIEFVSITECITRKDIFSRRRKESICVARRIIYHLSKTLTDKSFPDIGRLINGRDHTTILHGYHQMETMRRQDKYLDAKLRWYESNLTGGAGGQTV